MRNSRGLVPPVALSHVDGEGFYLQPDPRLRILYPHFYGGRRLLFMAAAEKLIVAPTHTHLFRHISPKPLKHRLFHARACFDFVSLSPQM